MSKIEVNTVEPQCGTTLTLGGSGDTVALGSGASQTGFGRTGTVDWETTPKVTGDSPVTAVSGKGYFLNTTAGTITVNLPAGAAGSIVSMADYAGTWQTYNVTVSPNGSEKIGGTNADATLNIEGQSVTLVYVDAVQGWVNTMDSTSNVRAITFVTATVSGACNTLVTAPDCANTKIATFVNPGTFCVSQVHPCAANNLVSYMIVAGGGSGGGGSGLGGGGGAGGYRETKSPVTPYTASPLCGYSTPGNRITVTATPYPIDVGAGGAAVSPGTRGNSGVNSTFSTITAAGGGGGGGSNTSPLIGGIAGGSGGGGGENSGCIGSGGGAGNTPPTTPVQGSDGKVGLGSPPGASAGGGGGAGGCGQAGQPSAGGAGGPGVTSEITASPVARAGGGGGAGYLRNPGSGGSGGGGSGSSNPIPAVATAGTVNTGGGGGGGVLVGAPLGAGAGGGSGIVVIRYKFQ